MSRNDLLHQRLVGLLPIDPITKNTPDPRVARNINAARSAFVIGYAEFLEHRLSYAKTIMKKVKADKIGFAMEGAAMAMVILDELDKTNNKYFQILYQEGSEYQQSIYSIGAGLASAKLAKPIDWFPNALDLHHLSSVYDGYGFYLAYFKSLNLTYNKSMFSSKEKNNFFDRGCGRALWFSHMGKISAIQKVIMRVSNSRKEMLWNGVGVACAFTGNRFIEDKLLRAAGLYERNVFEGIKSTSKFLENLNCL